MNERYAECLVRACLRTRVNVIPLHHMLAHPWGLLCLPHDVTHKIYSSFRYVVLHDLARILRELFENYNRKALDTIQKSKKYSKENYPDKCVSTPLKVIL